ncbi:MAG: zinc ribbon domain-containing protein [Planctomycetota bacterium]|nr:MAG: zinc ribbon domain-containing protein [Planctomycetota bacterium]REJ92630.1 MAG: zinc ribbon domain-containing protein [Planctomycetota bacterium]REK26741.1 MAG: zinc ribbon domain-containing protein [Planctomycetota bacterium]REK34739.1 MAG: zinc ribbon domain-containing protein [Planctomycetota bacterium]
MPTYDYECRKCQHTWEAFQPITANPLRKCPECGKMSAKRVIGPGAAILFKGSGFYQTDYRSDSYKQAAEADKKSSEPAKSESGDGSSSKSETPKKSEKSD